MSKCNGESIMKTIILAGLFLILVSGCKSRDKRSQVETIPIQVQVLPPYATPR